MDEPGALDAATGRELPSGTITMLFTDIEGSTRLARSLGNRYQIVLADHHRVLRDAWRENAGQEISTEGDSFFVVFRRTQDAVAAAAQAQRSLAAHRWPEGADLRVRMGMNTGEPTLGGEGYVGLAVHRAARIAAAAHGGQVLLSEASRQILEGDELDGINLRDLGLQRLKDFDQPQHLYQLEVEGLQAVFPPLKTLAAQEADELPFVGQEAVLAAAARSAIDSDAQRRTRRRLWIVAGAIAVAAAGAAIAVALSSSGTSGNTALSTVSSTPPTTPAITHPVTAPQTKTHAAAPQTTTSPPTTQTTSPTTNLDTTQRSTPTKPVAPASAASHRTRLTIRFVPRKGRPASWTLTCAPAGGTHPQPAIACAELVHHPKFLLPGAAQCRSESGIAKPRAAVFGRFKGKPVRKSFRPGCGAKFFKSMHIFFTG